MPDTTITIDRDQRDGLYELVRNHLGGIEDFWVALERTKDFVKAQELSLEFVEDFRLLQDIGWDEDDERETFNLTTPAHDLMELLKRLHGEAVKILVESGSEAQTSREDADTDRRFQLGCETCEKCWPSSTPEAGSQHDRIGGRRRAGAGAIHGGKRRPDPCRRRAGGASRAGRRGLDLSRNTSALRPSRIRTAFSVPDSKVYAAPAC